MIIEGYVFIPYQGQLRFRFDSDGAEDKFLKSDSQYDPRLILNLYECSARPPTCREFVFSGKRAQYESKILVGLARLAPYFAANPKLILEEVIDTFTIFDCEATRAARRALC